MKDGGGMHVDQMCPPCYQMCPPCYPQAEVEEVVLDSDSEEEVYNPLDIPLGWDGKPIPYWLYKLHGLNQVCWLFLLLLSLLFIMLLLVVCYCYCLLSFVGFVIPRHYLLCCPCISVHG